MVLTLTLSRVIPPEIARSIRRPRPNSLKLSGFVENSSLIILVVGGFFVKVRFRKDTIKIQKMHFLLFKKKKKKNSYRNCDVSPPFLTRIFKPSTYSDSS